MLPSQIPLVQYIDTTGTSMEGPCGARSSGTNYGMLLRKSLSDGHVDAHQPLNANKARWNNHTDLLG